MDEIKMEVSVKKLVEFNLSLLTIAEAFDDSERTKWIFFFTVIVVPSGRNAPMYRVDTLGKEGIVA